jgi:hypothetical protein
MSPRLRRFWTLSVALVALGSAAACGGADDATAEDDEAEVQERKSLFGDDRVGRALLRKLDKVPSTFQEYEKLFKVGRECAREDSKEIFVVEESTSREGGQQEQRDHLLPRAVVTGCNTGDRSDSNTLINSFGLMTALISTWSGNPRDPMVYQPLEVMALDERTGTYNFYVFSPTAPGKPGTVKRVMRQPDGQVLEIRLEGKRAKKVVSQDKQCFNCHVNGGPLMNEMSRPWTNWVSVLKTLPKEQLEGETASIVDEAAPMSGGHTRSSFANDLEQTMKAAVRVWINGIPDKPSTGFGLMTLEGSAPGGIPLMLKSVFCETELNYLSSSDTVPTELFVDRDVTAGAQLVEPPSIPGQVFPFQLPVRSEHDKRMEKYLQKSRFLTPRTVAAVRLVDDERDIFSRARCDLHAEVAKATFSKDKPEEVDAKVREVLAAKLKAKAFGALSPAREVLMTKLVDPAKFDDAAVQQAREEYFAKDLRPRWEKATAQLQTAAGKKALEARASAAKTAARAMFPGRANPLPVLE